MKLWTPVLWGLPLLASLLAATLLAYFTWRQMAIVGIIPIISGLVGLLLILMALMAWGLAKVRGAAGRRGRGRYLLVAGIFFVLQLAYLPAAQALRHREVNRAQAFIAALIPQIEAYKEQHGAYPATVEAVLTDDVSPPALLQLRGNFPLEYDNQDFYFQQGTTYAFRFYVPDGFIGFSYAYCCGSHGQWTVSD
jgi:hypothetical protein